VVSGTRVHPLRYLAVVGVQPRFAIVAMAAIAVLGLVTVWLNASELDSGLGMILFGQMFLASSGFVVRARQGHLDPLLASISKRTPIVIADWILSVAPGLAAWLIVAGAGLILGSPAAASALAGRRACGLFVVSSLAWVLGFALPRGAAGMLWMAVLLTILTQRTELLPGAVLASPAAGTVLRQALTLVLCPFLFVGNHPPVAPAAMCAAFLLSFVVLLMVWRLAAGLDIYLVDRT
jgi:hypothetical protein